MSSIKVSSKPTIGPVFFTISILVWTVGVSPYTNYGDNWALYPVLAAAIAVILWHIYLIVRPGGVSRSTYAYYGAGHTLILFGAVMWSLMKISKDAL